MSLKREVSLEWSLGWGLVIINQPIKFFFVLPWNLLQLLFQAARECIKKLSLLVILCLKFPQVLVHQYINELAVICGVKLVIFLTTVYVNLSNLVPRVLSYPPYGARERETLENAGHMAPERN